MSAVTAVPSEAASDDVQPAREPSSAEIGDASGVLDALQAACASGTSVALMSTGTATSCPGRLRGVTAEYLVIELARSPGNGLTQGDLCAVTLPLGGRTAGFMAPLYAIWHLANGRVRVTLETPTRIRRTEMRVAVRLPVFDDTVKAGIFFGEDCHRVDALDLSLHGMLVDVGTPMAARLRLGHRRMVVLAMGDDALILEAEVRRVDGTRLGLMFMLRETRPPALARMVAELQRRWNAMS